MALGAGGASHDQGSRQGQEDYAGWLGPGVESSSAKIGKNGESPEFPAFPGSLSLVAFRRSWRGILLIHSSKDIYASLGSVKLRNPTRVPTELP